MNSAIQRRASRCYPSVHALEIPHGLVRTAMGRIGLTLLAGWMIGIGSGTLMKKPQMNSENVADYSGREVAAAEAHRKDHDAAEALQKSIADYQQRQQEEAERLFEANKGQWCDYTDEEIYEVANCVEAEAGNQSYEGMRLVACVIWNRVDDKGPLWPNTPKEVVEQKNQFTSYWDGGMDRWKPTDRAIQAAKEELEDRSDPDIFYFREDFYSEYGTPRYKVGCHYFSAK